MRWRPDYAPFSTGIGGDPAIPFQASFPSTSVDSKSARLVAVVDRPEAHFTRRAIIAQIRLSEW